jgi:RND family efflux transporter MFP subunit
MERMRGQAGREDKKMNYESGFSRKPDAVEYIPASEDMKPRRSLLWPLIGLITIAVILAAAWFAFNRPAADKAQTAGVKPAAADDKSGKQAPSVTVVVPGQQTVPNVINATGTLAARRDMPVGAVGEGGLVTRVLVETGQWVGAGQVLAIVDRQVQTQQSSQIAAQIQAAEAEARLAQNDLDRARALASRGFVSKADIDRKTAQRDGAQARVRIARAQLNENAARIRRLDIRAPAAGLVLSRNVEQGQVVGPGAGALFRIAMGGEMEMHAQLSETDLVRTAVGYGAKVTPVGSEREFAGRIWQVAPLIDPQTRQGSVRIALGYDRALRPGGFASAKINSGAIVAPVLPESAVQSDAKGNYVYIVGPDNKIARRDVKVGSITDLGVSIVAGLDGIEQVVERAGGFLNTGETVAPKRAPLTTR